MTSLDKLSELLPKIKKRGFLLFLALFVSIFLIHFIFSLIFLYTTFENGFVNNLVAKSALYYELNFPFALKSTAIRQLDPLFFRQTDGLITITNDRYLTECQDVMDKINSFEKVMPKTIKGPVMAIVKTHVKNKYYIFLGNRESHYVATLHVDGIEKEFYWKYKKLIDLDYMACDEWFKAVTTQDYGKSITGDIQNINQIINNINEGVQKQGKTYAKLWLRNNGQEEIEDLDSFFVDKYFIPFAIKIELDKNINK